MGWWRRPSTNTEKATFAAESSERKIRLLHLPLVCPGWAARIGAMVWRSTRRGRTISSLRLLCASSTSAARQLTALNLTGNGRRCRLLRIPGRSIQDEGLRPRSVIRRLCSVMRTGRRANPRSMRPVTGWLLLRAQENEFSMREARLAECEGRLDGTGHRFAGRSSSD